MGSTTYKIIRVLFIIFNCISIAMGIAMVAVGSYVYAEKGDFLNLMPKYEDVNIAAVMIAAGIIVFVVAFIGFCGAWLESQCMLIMFFTAIFIIFAIEIAVGIVGFIYRDDIEKELREQLKAGLQEEKRRSSWDTIQRTFKCCGVDSYKDWTSENGRVPDSCCGENTCFLGMIPAYQQGCYSKARDEIEDNFYVLGAAGIALGVLQILLLVMTLVLFFAIRRFKGTVA